MPSDIQEYEIIVEYCYHPKLEHFVVRFLDGSSYILEIIDLPKKLQTKKPNWEETVLTKEKNAILVTAKKDVRKIPAYLIHSVGKCI